MNPIPLRKSGWNQLSFTMRGFFLPRDAVANCSCPCRQLRVFFKKNSGARKKTTRNGKKLKTLLQNERQDENDTSISEVGHLHVGTGALERVERAPRGSRFRRLQIKLTMSASILCYWEAIEFLGCVVQPVHSSIDHSRYSSRSVCPGWHRG